MAGGDPIPEIGAASLSKSPIDWRLIDKQIETDLSFTHFELSSHLISPESAEQAFTLVVVSKLSKFSLLDGKRPTVNPRGPHRRRTSNL